LPVNTGFSRLLAPGRIGAMTVRNRVVMSLMETMYGTPDGLPPQRTRNYFTARAKGGVGLITLGATGVDDQHPETAGGLHLATDAAVDAHRPLVEVVHECDEIRLGTAKVCLGQTVSADGVVRAAPDAVVVATGGRRRRRGPDRQVGHESGWHRGAGQGGRRRLLRQQRRRQSADDHVRGDLPVE
jgi:hypothetical protein